MAGGYIERCRKIGRLMHGRDYYFSFPTYLYLNRIEPDFFSKFLIMVVDKQKYPSAFRVIRLLRDDSIALPKDTFSERILEEFDKERFPVIIFPGSDIYKKSVIIDNLRVCKREICRGEFCAWISDEFLKDIIPAKICKNVLKYLDSTACNNPA